MNLKTLASAVIATAAAASFNPASAGISTINTAELFLVVFDDSASYSFDTGIQLDSFLGTSGLANTAASNFSFNVGALYAGFSTSGGAVPKQWALFAIDAEGVGLPGEFRILSTGTNNIRPDFLDAGNLQSDVGQMESAVVSMNQTSPSGAAFAGNGESFNAKGTAAYYDDSILRAANTRTANPVGVSSSVWLAYNPSFDSSDQTAQTKLAGTATFNGATFGYAVTAVPEPGTIALMLAGLGVVGFLARRRQA